MNLGVLGLGKLGLPLAATLANNTRHNVMGYDAIARYNVALQQREYESPEPDCDYTQVQIMPHIEPLVRQSDMIFCCVNTPSLEDGTMDLSQVSNACAAMDEVCWKITVETKREIPRLPVIMNSTVMPGTCRSMNEKYQHLEVISNPVWIAIGTVVKDLKNPPGMVIGTDEIQSDAAQLLQGIWQEVRGWGELQVTHTDTRTAEFIKMAHNAVCTIKMSWLGNIGDKARELGIDVHALTTFLEQGGDRPGKFWKYGPPFGGQCFPRDLGFWNQCVEDPIGHQAQVMNHYRFITLAEAAANVLKHARSKRVVLLGRSYKYGVRVYEDSASITLGHLLDQYGLEVEMVDQGERVSADASLYILMHKELEHLVPQGKLCINPWRAL